MLERFDLVICACDGLKIPVKLYLVHYSVQTEAIISALLYWSLLKNSTGPLPPSRPPCGKLDGTVKVDQWQKGIDLL